jgi:hypothetical protein
VILIVPLLVILEKKFPICELMALITHFGNLIKDIKYIGILARKVFNKAILAACDINFPCHP